MLDGQTVKVSFRLDEVVYHAIDLLAKSSGIETNAYIQRVITRHAANSDAVASSVRARLKLADEIISTAVATAQKADAAGQFDEDFVLTVFRHLMAKTGFRAKYEEFVGGDAYASGLPGKSPINMYLGWYIKNAVGADPLLDQNGKPRRAQVRNEPIQSYTLLRRGKRTKS